MKHKLITLFILSLGFALPAFADQESLLADLQTNCYDVYQPKFEAANSNMPGIVTEQFDWNALADSLPEDITSAMGVNSADLANLQDMLATTNDYMAPLTKQAYLDTAQVRVDLAQCYVDHGADAGQLLADAQALYQSIDQYDFKAAYNKPAAGTNLLTVSAGNTKNVRLRTFCLDGGRRVPENGEAYYLSGSIADLQSEGLCDVLKTATSSATASTAQANIWGSYNTTLRPSSEIAATNPNPTTTIATANVVTDVIKVDSENMVGTGLAIGGALLLVLSIISAAAHWLPKPAWITGLIIGLGLAAVGIIAIVAKTAAAQTAQAQSLLQANQNGLVSVTARSTGSFTSLDVVVTNLSDTDLTLDTSCLTFIPSVVELNESDFDEDDDTDSAANGGDINTDNDDSDTYTYDPDTGTWTTDASLDSQRLGTGDIIDDDPPPSPWWPPIPEPDDTLDIKELQKKVKKDLDDATKKFQDDPTEDNLKDAIKQRKRCELIGCNQDEEGADEKNWEDLGKGWQKSVDKAVDNYTKDPSAYNREQLQRATELGQLLGSNTDAAVALLIE